MAKQRSAPGSTNSPAILFGAELRHAREAMSYSQGDLANLLHVDRSLVCRIEAGERVPQRHFVEGCDRALNTSGRIKRIWSQVDWYAEIEHPDWFQRYADMEAQAVAVRQFQLARISGLLQTEDYARAMFCGGLSEWDEARIDELVAARMSRQRRFLTGGAPLLIVVLDESAIRCHVGNPEVMRGQLDHLLTLAQRPNVVLQVAPFDRYDLRRPDASMTLLTLPDGHDWVYSESLDRGHFVDNPEVIADYARTYDLLRAGALSPRETVAFITSAREGYDHDAAGAPSGSVAQEQPQRDQRRRVHRGGPRIHRRRPRPGQ
ncbi:helix-turn-helix domain-containing protein [Peterkaempfera bronchialis]|uniref:XRE family transcriptional regulator n=1 Tax=Peterkaempfera bronchialis TaxID=2126346 RepID=A0A345SW33_9ACTN|nr:helix-turn-helix transcriptional regulator [Peterkaempfera bronchialis]AXI77938.1 XRE family transcriptional regulator [Peterkaempfera bronchialis]